MTPAEIEPATFRFVAQHLNHCATAVPKNQAIVTLILKKEGNVFVQAIMRRVCITTVAVEKQ